MDLKKYKIVAAGTEHVLTLPPDHRIEFVSFEPISQALYFSVDGRPHRATIVAGSLAHPQGVTLVLDESGTEVTVQRCRQFSRSGSAQFSPAARSVYFHPTQPSNTLVSPLAGRVVRVLAQPGASVTANQPLVVIESMKMENEICAPFDGFIQTVSIAEGNLVQTNQVLVTFAAGGSPRQGQ